MNRTLLRRAAEVAVPLLLIGGLASNSGAQSSVNAPPAERSIAADKVAKWDGPYGSSVDPMVSESGGLSSGKAYWWFAYTTNSRAHPHHYNVISLESDSGNRARVNAPGTQAWTGGISGYTVVFTQRYPGQDSDLFKGTVDGPPRIAFPRSVNTAQDESRPTMTGRWLLFTRHNSATDTYRVLLRDRKTKHVRTLATESGGTKALSGQVLGDYAVWHVERARVSDVYRYQISTRETVRIPRNYFPIAHDPGVAGDGTVYYHRRADVKPGWGSALVKYTPEGRTEVLYKFMAGLEGSSTYVNPPGLASDRGLFFTVENLQARRSRSSNVHYLGD